MSVFPASWQILVENNGHFVPATSANGVNSPAIDGATGIFADPQTGPSNVTDDAELLILGSYDFSTVQTLTGTTLPAAYSGKSFSAQYLFPA